jgi:hypothetical protein
VELVDTLDLGSSAERCKSSSLLGGTKYKSGGNDTCGHMSIDRRDLAQRLVDRQLNREGASPSSCTTGLKQFSPF